MEQTKFCKFCGSQIDFDCVICPKCGKQVESLKQDSAPIVINNSASSSASAAATATSHPSHGYGRAVNKAVALFLAIFFGWFGAHKFYEGKIGTGLLYVCTFGLFLIGWIMDIFNILGKPDPYYVN